MAVFPFHTGLIHPRERLMKKIVYALAALATIAIAVPSIANAEDTKPGMMKEGKDAGMMHRHRHYHMDMRHHHHMMKKDMMKKEM